jgi:hypothetical protein
MTAAQRERGQAEWRTAHPAAAPAVVANQVESYTVPQGYNDTADHIANFFRAVNTREHVVEDEVFGHHAAIGCHMANQSYFGRTIAVWDAETETIRQGPRD